MNEHTNEEKYFVHDEPEFQLILVNPGPQISKITILVRQRLGVSPAEARRRVKQCEVVVAEELSYWQATQMKSEFESLGAVVRLI